MTTPPTYRVGTPPTAPLAPNAEDSCSYDVPPPQPPSFEVAAAASASSPSSSRASSPGPPPFSSIYESSAPEPPANRFKAAVTETTAAVDDNDPEQLPTPPVVADTKVALDCDCKGESSGKSPDDREPPPPYTEGSSPIESFTYVMAAAGGAASIITQVQQAGAPLNTLGGMSPVIHSGKLCMLTGPVCRREWRVAHHP